MRKGAGTVTHEALVTLLNYDKRSGLLTWRVNRSRLAKAGDEAGAVSHTGMVLVGIQGKSYTAAQLIWFYVTGVWPEGRIHFNDGDMTNLKWTNLAEELPDLSRKPANVYQRRYNRLTRLAREHIAAHPDLLKVYNDPDDPRSATLLQRVRTDLANDFARNKIDPAFRPARTRRRKPAAEAKP